MLLVAMRVLIRTHQQLVALTVIRPHACSGYSDRATSMTCALILSFATIAHVDGFCWYSAARDPRAVVAFESPFRMVPYPAQIHF